MTIAQFPCPHCQAPLRIQSRSFLGREVDCPHCGEPIRIVRDADRQLVAESRATVTAAQKKGRHAAASPWSGIPKRLATPTGIAWTIAGIVGVGLLWLGWSSGEAERPAKPTRVAAPVEPPNVPVAGVAPMAQNEPQAPQADARLERLGRDLGEYADRHGHFPRGVVEGDLPVEQRFGWLALLAAENEPNFRPVPQWDQAWDDPLNEHFVRRSQPRWLNPGVPQKAGRDRYPATHYVGVAGVGTDAPRLPKNHPRAGIFGYERRTRLEDVTDGLANTLLVAGVQQDLGSWAAGGRSSIRAFTQEPYVNGPDGFGTGQRDGMFLLMADGRVKFLNLDTDPEVMRRLAAMADGLPSDPNNPGELPEQIAAREPFVPPAPEPPPNPQPEPELVNPAPEPPKAAVPAEPLPDMPQQNLIDVAAALQTRIQVFDQSQAVPFRDVLDVVAEMVGVPVRFDTKTLGPAAAKLDAPVSLRIENTTLAELLTALTEKVGLAYKVHADHLELQPAEQP